MGADRSSASGGGAPLWYPGRRRLGDRPVLCGILFVLHTGIPWRHLPWELGFGSGMTCWRRLRDWNDAGVWQRLHELLLAELRGAGLLDFSRAAVDSSHVRAMKGGPATGPLPVDRGRTGSKHHLIFEAHGIPLATTLTGGNRNDVTQLLPLIEAIPPVRGRPGAPRRRPRRVYADRGYDHDTYRDRVRRLEITPVIARRTAPARLRPRGVPLGRGGHDRTAALVPPPAHSLGAPRRHPPSFRHARLRHHLLATASELMNRVHADSRRGLLRT